MMFRWERNGTIAYCSTFGIAFLVVQFFGTDHSEEFSSERNPSAFHFSNQYGTKWNDCFPT